MKRILNKWHTPETFIAHGLKEKSTWVAIAFLIFGFIFRSDIFVLIHNILNNSKTTDLIITSLPVLCCFILAWLKEKK
mgnify:CR=1 FL=1